MGGILLSHFLQFLISILAESIRVPHSSRICVAKIPQAQKLLVSPVIGLGSLDERRTDLDAAAPFSFYLPRDLFPGVTGVLRLERRSPLLAIKAEGSHWESRLAVCSPEAVEGLLKV